MNNTKISDIVAMVTQLRHHKWIHQGQHRVNQGSNDMRLNYNTAKDLLTDQYYSADGLV